jgi:citrate lyase beta subunit
VGGERLGGYADVFEHGWEVRVDLVVPDTENGVAGRFEAAISDAIVGAIHMLGSVEFENQSLLDTQEVNDVAGERDLPTEFVAESLSPDGLPE